MEPLKKWLKKSEIKSLKRVNLNKLLSNGFFRDPLRRLYYNPNKLYAPADGIILYAYENIGPTEKILEVKGQSFTVQDLLYDRSYFKNSLVIGIFMSVLDVHINRMPSDGYISEVAETPFIYTHNTSMLSLEGRLLSGRKFLPEDLNYLFRNEKLVTTVYCPKIKGYYYIVQIADKDVNCIVNWGEGDYLQQGERFGMIRWGSQVDLVIELKEDSPVEYKVLAKPLHHVEGGIDALVEIVDKEK